MRIDSHIPGITQVWKYRENDSYKSWGYRRLVKIMFEHCLL